MHDANRSEIANMALEEINHDFLETTFNIGLREINKKYQELFAGQNGSRSDIGAISTWNKELDKVKRRKFN